MSSRDAVSHFRAIRESTVPVSESESPDPAVRREAQRVVQWPPVSLRTQRSKCHPFRSALYTRAKCDGSPMDTTMRPQSRTLPFQTHLPAPVRCAAGCRGMRHRKQDQERGSIPRTDARGLCPSLEQWTGQCSQQSESPLHCQMLIFEHLYLDAPLLTAPGLHRSKVAVWYHRCLRYGVP